MYEKTPLLSDTLSDKPFASIIAHILYGLSNIVQQ